MTATRELGRSGLHVRPLAFGGNVFGWSADEKASFALLDAFVDAGRFPAAGARRRLGAGTGLGSAEDMIGAFASVRDRGAVDASAFGPAFRRSCSLNFGVGGANSKDVGRYASPNLGAGAASRGFGGFLRAGFGVPSFGAGLACSAPFAGTGVGAALLSAGSTIVSASVLAALRVCVVALFSRRSSALGSSVADCGGSGLLGTALLGAAPLGGGG